MLRKLPISEKLSEDSTQDDFNAVWGDYHLTFPTILFAEEFASKSTSLSPTNRYFAYRLMQSTEVLGLFSLPAWMGVTHGEDVFYLFMKQLAWFGCASNYQLSVDMIESWTHFAKFGYSGKVGGVDWEEAIKNQKNNFTQYMHLEEGKYAIVGDHFVPTCNTFWKYKMI